MERIIVTAFAALMLLGAGAASAQTASSVVLVGYGDLDLGRADGRTVLENRLAMAVDRVCGPQPGARELARQQQYAACRHDAAVGAERQVAALYQERRLAAAGAPSR